MDWLWIGLDTARAIIVITHLQIYVNILLKTKEEYKKTFEQVHK